MSAWDMDDIIDAVGQLDDEQASLCLLNQFKKAIHIFYPKVEESLMQQYDIQLDEMDNRTLSIIFKGSYETASSSSLRFIMVYFILTEKEGTSLDHVLEFIAGLEGELLLEFDDAVVDKFFSEMLTCVKNYEA